MEHYVFLFPGGAGGSFVKKIWYYYLQKNGLYHRTVRLTLNVKEGDAHDSRLPVHYHDFNDLIERKTDKTKIVFIDFSLDDLKTIATMQYHKQFKDWVKEHKEEAMATWPLLDLTDEKTTEKSHSEMYISGHQHYHQKVQYDKIDYIIEFKTVFGLNEKNLNEEISKMLGFNLLSEIDEYIKEYRLINKKYFDGPR